MNSSGGSRPSANRVNCGPKPLLGNSLAERQLLVGKRRVSGTPQQRARERGPHLIARIRSAWRVIAPTFVTADLSRGYAYDSRHHDERSMSGHRPFSEIRRGPPGSWNRVAGNDQSLHYFPNTSQPEWWRAATCGAGPAIGKTEGDAKLDICSICLPVEAEDFEDVEGIHNG